MYKIRKIKFVDHPILNNLELDFCDKEGNAIDTIILAGENGTGKSTILDVLYQVSSSSLKVPLEVEFDNDGIQFSMIYSQRQGINAPYIHVDDGQGLSSPLRSTTTQKKYQFNG